MWRSDNTIFVTAGGSGIGLALTKALGRQTVRSIIAMMQVRKRRYPSRRPRTVFLCRIQ